MTRSRLFSLGLYSLLFAGGMDLHAERGKNACCPAPVCAPTWAGIYPTVVTPWKCCGGVDEASLKAQCEYQLRGGVHGLLVLGTIGEGEFADADERAAVIRTAVKAAGKCPVIVGIHTCDLDIATAQLKQAQELGAAAVLVKYIGNPKASGQQVFGFIAELAEQRRLPIFYYHYPSQTKLKLKPAEVAAILSVRGVVGIKESTLDLDEIAEHVALTRGLDTTFLTGTALNLTQFMELGGHGAMCPEALLLPCLTVQAYNAQLMGEGKAARASQKKLFVVAPLLKGGMTSEGSTRLITMAAQDHTVTLPMGNDHPQARLKAALDGLGICTPAAVKCSLPELSLWDKHKVAGAVKKMSKLECCVGMPEPCSSGAQFVPSQPRCASFLPPK